MRSLMMMNRIQVITRPATSGFNFPCFKQPQNVIANIGKEGHDQDWDRNRYRYRRYQAHFAYERYQTVCIRVFQGADGFCFIKIMGCQLSWESVCFASRRSQVRNLYAPLDHQYNGQNTSLRTKRYRFDSYMVYLCHLCKHRCKPCFASLDSAPQNASCYRRTFDFFEIERLEANASL